MNILITGAFKCNNKSIQKIKDLGYTVFFQQYEQEELIVQPEIIDIVVCNGLFMYHNIEQFVNLKKILLTSAGLDRVPVNYCNEKGITIYNAKDVYSIPMAEFVVMSILMIYKHSVFFYKNQTNKVWEKNRNLLELNGKSVGILGVGSVGKEVAKKLSVFGTTIYGFDIETSQKKYFDVVKHISSIKQYLSKLDIIVCCLPITQDTKNLINYDFLSKMKDTSILVNVSRGGIINEKDLCNILDFRKEMAVVLDVFEKEPLSQENELWTKDNVYIYPHNSFVSDGINKRLEDLVMGYLEGFI